MPAQVRQACFQPISPLLDLDKLVEETERFEYVPRVSYEMMEAQGSDALEKLILLHVVLGGKPLVIEGFQNKLPRHLFNHTWLDDNWGKREESPRDLARQQDMPMTVGNYLRHMSKLTEQWHVDSQAYLNPDAQRLYLKDIDCPDAWRAYLSTLIPPSLFYLNESTGELGGAGATDEELEPYCSKIRGRGAAPAGDLMSSLPPSMRAENMMCYIGHEGTYTPAHREMCASLGHNLMVETSGIGVDRWGKLERPGSSIWFMTETKDRHLVSEYWLSILGHDIEVENHFAQIAAWKNAPFKTYVVEQRVGDFILVPPLAPHQVWNRGTRTMKVAWNRTTVETLEMALSEALPRARMVCRDEQYKNKAMIYHTMIKYAALLARVRPTQDPGWSAAMRVEIQNSRKIGQLKKDFRRLYHLYTDLLLSEMFAPERTAEKKVDFVAFDSNITCSFCRCNIFNRFLTCKSCIETDGADEDAYDVCMECYAMGRSCACVSGLTWVEQFQWKELTERHDAWRRLVIELDGGITDASPLPLAEARKRLAVKTLAQICQEQLKIRPWRDHTRALTPEEDSADEENPPETDDKGRKRKRRTSNRSGAWKKRHANCHICKHQEVRWKLARCECGLSYCYGTLFRAFDLKPRDIMENPKWQCPRCLSICSCGACRKDPAQRPHDPKGTLVGHDTRLVADPRSVESLVDFSRSNLTWIKEPHESESPYETIRLQRFREQAEREKARDETLNDAYVDNDDDDDAAAVPSGHGSDMPMDDAALELSSNHIEDLPIDPLLQSFPEALPVQQSLSSTDPEAQIGGTQDEVGDVKAGLPDWTRLDRAAEESQSAQRAPTVTEATADPSSSILEPNSSALLASAGLAILDGGEPDERTSPPRSGAPTAVKVLDSSPHASNLLKVHPNTSAVTTHVRAPPRMVPTPRRRKRSSQDAANGDLAEANRQFQQAQMHQTLADAKKTDSFTMTQARLQGKSRIVQLPLGAPSFQQLKQDSREPQVDTWQSGVGGDGSHDGTGLQSVVPSITAPRIRASRTPSINNAKRTPPHSEDDPSARKQVRRPTQASPNLKGTHLSRSLGGRQSRTFEDEESQGASATPSGSASDGASGDHSRSSTNGRATSSKARPTRQMAREVAWLARREQKAQDKVKAPRPTNGAPVSMRYQSAAKATPATSPGSETEEEVYMEVDDDYNPIELVTASLKREKVSRSSVTPATSSPPQRKRHRRSKSTNGNGTDSTRTLTAKQAKKATVDPYHDAKAMALRRRQEKEK
ncbi:MAG: hypothetical protein M1838_003543 [Thelocarpon superellum]|nr:MAG: hypothetical protein M1838_003543 [Thelocarpon superellum]